jgi:class 3 adenylate cyclase
MTSNLNEGVLSERLAATQATYRGDGSLVNVLGEFIRTAPESQIVRINPIAFARARKLPERQVIDLFLHARKAGLLTMEWHYVCRGCGQVVESFTALNDANEHFFCKTCLGHRDADLSDFVEVGFSVSPAVRGSRFLDPSTLTAEEHLDFSVSENALNADSVPLRQVFKRDTMFVCYVDPGETRTFNLVLGPGHVGFSHGRDLVVNAEKMGPNDSVHCLYLENRVAEPFLEVAPGPLEFHLTNGTSSRFRASAFQIANPGQWNVRLADFLSGSQLLSTQTFLNLFPSETVMSSGGLAIKRVTLLFTDLKGSTALYDRIGDMKAFNLVRQHFGVLRDVITANEGALVKTIGDAVMASFTEPSKAVRAARDMLARIAEYNAAAGEEIIVLKIGAHCGPSLAVTLNDHLDYFGQTVNLAARVQGLAEANEIWLTDDLYRQAGLSSDLKDFDVDQLSVRVKGIDRDVLVHRLRLQKAGHPRD